jgi:hypothetical protein
MGKLFGRVRLNLLHPAPRRLDPDNRLSSRVHMNLFDGELLLSLSTMSVDQHRGGASPMLHSKPAADIAGSVFDLTKHDYRAR